MAHTIGAVVSVVIEKTFIIVKGLLQLKESANDTFNVKNGILCHTSHISLKEVQFSHVDTRRYTAFKTCTDLVNTHITKLKRLIRFGC